MKYKIKEKVEILERIDWDRWLQKLINFEGYVEKWRDYHLKKKDVHIR